MINVFFPYYSCGDGARQKEIDLCLKRNVDNPCIDHLMVMVDDGSSLPVQSSKITQIDLNDRPTYQLWVEMTRKYGLTGSSILCNSDIYFDETVLKLGALLEEGEKFLALSRWELLGGGTSLHPNPQWSQDVWGIPCDTEFPKALLRQLDFPLGVPRCDNKVAYLFGVYGWSVFNPCGEVRAVHVHETQMRTYDKKIDARILGGVAYVHPSENEFSPSKLDMDIWVSSSEHIGALKLNKSMEKWRQEQAEEGLQAVDTASDTQAPTMAGAREAIDALKSGKVVHKSERYFSIYEKQGAYYFSNSLEPLRIVELKGKRDGGKLDPLMVHFIPPVLDTWAKTIGDKPTSKEDLHFWQYPCATEKQAYENHKKLSPFQHLNTEAKEVSVYLPLPWATYVDKKRFPDVLLQRTATVIKQYSEFARRSGYTLKVHTVCQHIHWQRIVEKVCNLGVTDLHLSHKTSRSTELLPESCRQLRLHGWPLIAVNYEIRERSTGLVRKPMKERKILASFIGAHMPHYLDDSRLKLYEAAKQASRDDVIVDLGNEWHFNRHVYEEQVLHSEVDSAHISAHEQKTINYNRLISNSRFSLCPVGAGPNTLRLWESIAVGSIPVMFRKDLGVFKRKGFSQVFLDNCIFWNKDISLELFNYLDSMSIQEVQARSDRLVELYKEVSECVTAVEGI